MKIKLSRSLGIVGLMVMMGVLSGSSLQAQVKGDAPYQSPMKEQCNAELDKDITWRAEIRDDLRASVHEEESASMLRNKQHVVAAYAVIWALMILFVLFMYSRQQKLSKEITRLDRELSKAAES